MLGQCLVFAVLGGFILGLFFTATVPFEMRQMADAREWPSRKGIITKSAASRKINLLQRPYWAVEICGSYKDNGVGFCVSRVRYGEFRLDEGEASSLAAVAKYHVGKEVDVFYSPHDPGKTVLEPDAPWTTMVAALALGIGLLLLPVLLFVIRMARAP
jgi:hypothetical protein